MFRGRLYDVQLLQLMVRLRREHNLLVLDDDRRLLDNHRLIFMRARGRRFVLPPVARAILLSL
ncbi:hypothetical protein UP10_01990 [Bradyrhizobium sp. LTSPM299]|nr:hypothetical protein UP10_01990 [Bradyrhizobium sp. LTSPM299]